METKNTFAKGMLGDISKEFHPEGYYRLGKNIRVIRNSDGSTEYNTDGSSYSVSQIKGTIDIMQVCDGYEPIGFLEVDSDLIIISTNDVNTQIGIYSKKQGTYTVLFDDKNDPNGDTLGFKKAYPILDIDACWENEFIKRLYFTDGRMEKKCFNLILAYNKSGIPYHLNQSCGASNSYPKWMSVHAMNDRMDAIFPRAIKFVKTISGSIKTGAYQFFVRYVSKDGHKSTISYVTRHVIVSQTKITSQSQSNHHNKTMYKSNEVTDQGIQLLIAGIDTRWDSIEVGFMFSITDNITHEAGIFHRQEANGNDITVNFQNHQLVEPISTDQINERFESIKSVNTFVQHKNRMYDGGVKIYPTIELNLSQATVEPYYRYMVADSTLEPAFAAVPNPMRGNNPAMPDNDPLTNSFPDNTTVYVNKFGTTKEAYSIVNDYENYKGMQFEHLFVGNWRGETYDYAAVVYDKKGNTTYSQHIKSFTFPQQYEGFDGSGSPKNTLTRYNASTGRYEIRLMGAKISGVRIPHSAIYDEFGRLNIGGFEIVRTKRVKQILHQGVVFPTVKRVSNDAADKNLIFPLPFLSNLFDSAYLTKYPNSHKHLVNLFDDTNNTVTDVWDSASHPFLCTYHSPDVLLEETISKAERTDYIRIVSAAHRGYTSRYIKLAGLQKHFYSKCYKTDTQDNSGANGRVVMGSRSRIKFSKIIESPYSKLKEFDSEDLETEFWTEDFATIRANGTTGSPFPLASLYPKNAVILKTPDFETVDVAKSSTDDSSFYIVNYERPSELYYASENEASTMVKQYQGTGHFQQINQQVLSVVDKEYNSDGSISSYVFNDIEVWGGDCYVNYFDFVKNIPYWERSCEKTRRGMMDNHYGESIPASVNPDYACGVVIPIESRYNLALRQGRSFAANATMPQATACDNLLPQFSNGVSVYSPEDWNINKVTTHQENIRIYSGKLSDVKIISDKQASIYVSDVKSFSELDDSYRKKRVLNYTDLQGNYGPIVSMQKAFNYIYVFQHSAYGILRASERAIIATNIGETFLGTGKDLDGVDYISFETGTKHRFSICKFNNSIYWVDAAKGTINKHSQAGSDNISDSNSQHDYTYHQTTFFDLEPKIFSGKNPFWISAEVDEEHEDVLFTFITPIGSKTLSYNEDLSSFHGFSDAAPRLYFRFGRGLYSVNRNDPKKISQHNRGEYGHFYGQFFDSELWFVVNPLQGVNKVFDNAKIDLNISSSLMIESIGHETESDTHYIIYSANGTDIDDKRVSLRNNLMTYPIFDKSKKVRLRGKYMTVKIKIKNKSGGSKVKINSFSTVFRPVQKV